MGLRQYERIGIVNSLTGYLNGVPQISTRDTQTSVHLKNNDTLVIGGLIEENSQRTISKIPFVGDIPLLGAAFRNDQTTTTKNELVIVVTPHLLDDAPIDGNHFLPGMKVPSPEPLPTVQSGLAFPIAKPAPVSNAISSVQKRAHVVVTPSPAASQVKSSPSPDSTPSAFAQANVFVFGSPPSNTYAGPGDAPQIFYAMLQPTLLSPSATVRVSAITTTNVQRVTVSNGSASVNLTSLSPGTWQEAFPASELGLSTLSANLQIVLTAFRSDGQSSRIPITASVMR